ncbi:hypothetical protein RHMOL_Rhmol12G0249600 [Rhododendron molle]|uniref:Uncharacterized protein n=1 Tax=Rhododendron molle TaxID=49168 RepID=A0ACC0LLX3_RHOML|nr:hypothetical protein RHMOL_Rhmol12G0249600 [Rhododendron molle]
MPRQRERAMDSQGSVLPWLRNKELDFTYSADAPPCFSAPTFKETTKLAIF